MSDLSPRGFLHNPTVAGFTAGAGAAPPGIPAAAARAAYPRRRDARPLLPHPPVPAHCSPLSQEPSPRGVESRRGALLDREDQLTTTAPHHAEPREGEVVTTV